MCICFSESDGQIEDSEKMRKRKGLSRGSSDCNQLTRGAEHAFLAGLSGKSQSLEGEKRSRFGGK